jgi:hypothetical protein
MFPRWSAERDDLPADDHSARGESNLTQTTRSRNDEMTGGYGPSISTATGKADPARPSRVQSRNCDGGISRQWGVDDLWAFEPCGPVPASRQTASFSKASGFNQLVKVLVRIPSAAGTWKAAQNAVISDVGGCRIENAGVRPEY